MAFEEIVYGNLVTALCFGAMFMMYKGYHMYRDYQNLCRMRMMAKYFATMMGSFLGTVGVTEFINMMDSMKYHLRSIDNQTDKISDHTSDIKRNVDQLNIHANRQKLNVELLNKFKFAKNDEDEDSIFNNYLNESKN